MAIGESVKRLEDPRLLTGMGCYAGDVVLPEQCEAVLVRSRHAYARITGIDVEGARRLPGVVCVLTAKDLPDDLLPIPMRLSPEKSLEYALQYPLAKDVVRYVGDPIAVVVAENRYIAEDAADRVTVQYETLQAITSVDSALASSSSVLHERIGRNDLFRIHSTKGDIHKVLSSCEYVFEEDFYVQRHSGIPLETRGIISVPGPDGQLLIYGAAKVVHFNRSVLAKLLNKSEADIRMIELDVGGGFGVRGEFYPEDYLVPYVSLQVGRPVRWIEDRLEHLQAINHSREQKHKLTIGYDKTGRIHALRDEIFVDMGAYIRTHGVTVPELTQGMLPGPYDISAIELVTHVVATNKTPTGTYRGPGRFESTFVRERAIDCIAQRLNIDPAAVRERNLIRPDQMPYSNGILALGQEIEFDSGDYPQLLDRAREKLDWDGFSDRKRESEQSGRLRGHGLAMFVEKSGYGPWEFAEVSLSPDGKFYCKSGLADVGQGVKTMLAQICADQFSVPYNEIRVVHGDTDVVKKGNGSFATRGTVVGGNAAWHAAGELKEQILDQGSRMGNVNRDRLELADGYLRESDTKKPLMSLHELATRCAEQGIELRAEHTFSAPHMTYPYGVHAAEVEIDKETGAVNILKYYIAYDIGRAVNPETIRGQLMGGMAQGLGGTFYEELRYDDSGQLLSGTFMDYLLPGATEVPEVEIEILENAPSRFNPLGLKGAGEGGTVAVAPALANAIANAIAGDDDETVLTSLPLRTETIRTILRQKDTRPAGVAE
ncbi:xanthine dehydrogenase family protein molybdopterin-binding subunit [Alicyclobacillus dauci]|uniref:Xanthine dehydrogenase family protein molybdopterin-binding subunit n=1 Tax=Alicyclobacillus dauci TaxID=1475485 RepID=A0ABY6YY72_9BACL|nr:xanthine dehydrogenase family protein molybdopterin-binding subunit [Alicyclobacillus dauci]WAH35208.1 xanthine dehydrogenase family protein molybdopterin-binding subunit [Alicyclobacillus dauci]